MTTSVSSSIDDLLAGARARIDRFEPWLAHALADVGSVIVDIRPQSFREAEGTIPGALIIERNVLEWRFDPRSDARLPIASYDLPVMLVCNEGYASSLAAATLRDLGIHRAGDVVGGFRAWRAAGLPVGDRSELRDS